MLESALRTTLAAIFTLGLIATASPAQTASPCGVMATGVMMYGGAPTTNKPFSATVQTTHEQKFVDGNAIHGLIVTHEYRDSAGRIRGETSMLCNMGPDGQFRPTISVSVNDPVAQASMSWQINGSGEKIARVHHQADSQSAAATPPPPPTDEQRRQSALVQEHWRKNTHGEKLGTRTIAGVLTDGSRQITTIPAGEQGNEQPIEMMTEVWIARDTGLAMLNIQDDPRSGRTTTEVTDLSQTDPDPSLFAPPPGYKLVEQVTTTRPVTTAAQ
jgi:hypothetical protein